MLAGSATLRAQGQDGIGEVRRLQTLLSVINLELKADLDQVTMLQEAIKANPRVPLEAQGRSPDAVSFDAMATAQRQAILREASLNARLEALLARSAVLDAQKQPLLERVRELGALPQPTGTSLTNSPN